MKKLCVAVPTYNRPLDVEKKIKQELDSFKMFNVDVHIFDSSENDETKKVVDIYSKKGYENIFSHHFEDNPSANEKVYRIFEWAADSEYEYIWLIHDHTVCSKEAVCYLLEQLDNNSDFLILNMQASECRTEQIDGLDDFLIKGAWRLNSFGASVIKVSTFLSGVDWVEMRKKYGGEKTENYSHIGFYFERAAQLNYCNVFQVFFDRKDFIDFNREKRIKWETDTIRICLECWGEVISRLPDCYSKKIEALRTQDKWFTSRYSLLQYRKKGFYDYSIFSKYKYWMKKIYPDDYFRNLMISVISYRLGMNIFCRKLVYSFKKARQNNKKIYIFGAGRHAVECASFLFEIDEDFDGFIVSDKKGNPEELLGKNVFNAKDVLVQGDYLILLGILTSGIPEVKKMLVSLMDKETNLDIVEMV